MVLVVRWSPIILDYRLQVVVWNSFLLNEKRASAWSEKKNLAVGFLPGKTWSIFLPRPELSSGVLKLWRNVSHRVSVLVVGSPNCWSPDLPYGWADRSLSLSTTHTTIWDRRGKENRAHTHSTSTSVGWSSAEEMAKLNSFNFTESQWKAIYTTLHI